MTSPSSPGVQRSSRSTVGPYDPALGDRDLVAGDAEDPAGDAGDGGAAEPDDEGRDVLRSEQSRIFIAIVRCHRIAEVLGHAGERGRRDRVDRDAVAPSSCAAITVKAAMPAFAAP